ncbi:tripartite tricarboxylate transporter substrate binding protein [Variovorax paradoxus]|nr:tripartite tricarboxylate transporter substrate binding protein [Variovorax paradoxus]MBT2305444.1 tripartite tricarboxylate transporter substrate binding protein [Variovorax paradoxus]
MKISRILAIGLLAVACAAFSQPYPEKGRPIRLVVPFGPGSGTDLIARAYGRAMSEQAGATVVVENKPGAEGVIGVEAVKNAPADGYTFLIANTSTHVLNVHMLQKIPYDPVADFVPLAGVAKFALVLNAGPSTKFKNAREALEAIRAQPGKYSYGSGTTSTRLGMEMLEHLANVKMLSVPYKSMAQATSALAAGEVDFLINDVATAKPHYDAGRVRPLGATGRERLSALPTVSTLKDQGVEGYDLSGWFAMFAPANTPPAVAATLRTMLREAAKSKYVADALAANSYEPLDVEPSQLSAMERADIERWGNLLKAMKKDNR